MNIYSLYFDWANVYNPNCHAAVLTDACMIQFVIMYLTVLCCTSSGFHSWQPCFTGHTWTGIRCVLTAHAAKLPPGSGFTSSVYEIFLSTDSLWQCVPKQLKYINATKYTLVHSRKLCCTCIWLLWKDIYLNTVCTLPKVIGHCNCNYY